MVWLDAGSLPLPPNVRDHLNNEDNHDSSGRRYNDDMETEVRWLCYLELDADVGRTVSSVGCWRIVGWALDVGNYCSHIGDNHCFLGSGGQVAEVLVG